jgi:hypothetical protein
MANLIDYTYFIGDINLPVSALSGTPAHIDSYIVRYEKEILISLLGYDLYKTLIAQVAPLPSPWDGLVNGSEYTLGSYTHLWDGLVNTEKVSLIAYYVYYHYVRDNVVNYESVGAVISQGENSARAAADTLMVAAYNNCVDLFNQAVEYISANQGSFPQWVLDPMVKINTFGI